MIKSLRLKNIALIESAEIDFDEKLNVLSGETGAGKTVIIGAINFVLGAKADKTMIRYGETECFAELLIDIFGNNEVKSILEDMGIDFDDEIIIRRKLTETGKSDIRVNGYAVTLSMLKQITSELCDVYGQSEHYSLLKPSNQLKVLDSYIGDEIVELKQQCKPLITEIKSLRKELSSFGGDARERANRIDVLSYQINEIEKAELYDGEEEELISRKKFISNIERIGEAVQTAKSCLSDDGAGLDCISLAQCKIESISDIDGEYSAINDRLYSLKAEVDDITSALENIIDGLEFDAAEFERVEARLDVVKSLKRKYGNTYSDILEFLSKSKIELENLQNFETRSASIEISISKKLDSLYKLYNKMTELRERSAEKFSDAICNELRTLGMKSAVFKCEVFKSLDDETLSDNGINSVEFTFSANAGEPLKTMSKIISGGEMSRFMLAMKLVSSDFANGSTYIFDEIDAGISGNVAETVAEKFAKLSRNMQLITISHLPQIVSFSDKSLLIKKCDDGVKTVTNIFPLDEDGKIKELTRIIGGDESSEISLIHAKTMIERADKIKNDLRN